MGSQNPHDSNIPPNTESSYLLSDSLNMKATTSINCHGLAKSTWQCHFIQYRVFLFAFRLLKIESNHEHELSWARKIHMTVPFHHYRVFLFAFRLRKIESNHEHELSWAHKIHMTVPFWYPHLKNSPPAPLGAMTNLLGSTSNQVAFVQSILQFPTMLPPLESPSAQ